MSDEQEFLATPDGQTVPVTPQMMLLAQAASPGKKMAYSHSMDDLVKNKYLAQQPPEDSIPFYPSDRHLEKGLAPERTVGQTDISGLAAAHKRAIENGVLSPELANYMLPIAMVEGRPGNYGIMTDNGFYWNRIAQKAFKGMGLPVVDLSDKYPKGTDADEAVEAEKFSGPNPRFVVLKDSKGDKFLNITSGGREVYNPALMAAILAIKNYGSGSVDETVQRWNGAGAQARHYLGKVQKAYQLLGHPKNAQLREAYEAEMKGEK